MNAKLYLMNAVALSLVSCGHGAEGVTLTPFDAISDPDRPRYNVAVCAETAALTMYSDELGNLVVRKE